MELGTRISDLRKKAGMTQEQLASLLGTTRQAVSKWESGKSQPDLDLIIRLGEIFNVSMDYLLLGGNSPAAAFANNRSISVAYLFVSITLLLISLILFFLLPLFAELYRNQVFGPTHVNADLYLMEWPMLGIVIIDALLFLLGVVGILYYFQDKVKQYIRNFVT